MTEEEIIKFYEELEEFYGETLANFEHHPRQFANQIRMYRYYKERINHEDSSLQRPAS